MNGPIQIALSDGPLGLPNPFAPSGAGAVLVFEGVVRPTEQGRLLGALEYEAYEPMTTRELRRLAEETRAEHGLVAIRVEHSVGRVAVGRVSFRLSLASAHRAEAIAAADRFILQMKQTVPLWKLPAYE